MGDTEKAINFITKETERRLNNLREKLKQYNETEEHIEEIINDARFGIVLEVHNEYMFGMMLEQQEMKLLEEYAHSKVDNRNE